MFRSICLQLRLMRGFPSLPSAIGYHHIVMLILTLTVTSTVLLLAGCTSSSSFGRNMYILSLSYKGSGSSVESSAILNQISHMIANATTGLEFEVRAGYFGLCFRNTETWSCQNQALTLEYASDPLEILIMMRRFRTDVLFPGLLIGSVVLATISWFLLATFPGWHSAYDDDGSEIDVKPFPNRTVVQVTLGATALAMLFAFVSAVWQHTSTATASTTFQASTFGFLQANTGAIGTAMVWINFCLLLLATIMMVLLLISLTAISGLTDDGSENSSTGDEIVMSGGIQREKKASPFKVIVEERQPFHYNSDLRGSSTPPFPAPPPPPGPFASIPPPPPGFGMRMPPTPATRTEQTHSQPRRSTAIRPNKNSTSNSAPNVHMDQITAEIEKLEAANASLLGSKQNVPTEDEEQVSKNLAGQSSEYAAQNLRRPILLPPPPTRSEQVTTAESGPAHQGKDMNAPNQAATTGANPQGDRQAEDRKTDGNGNKVALNAETTAASTPAVKADPPVPALGHARTDAYVVQTDETPPAEVVGDLYDVPS